MSMFQNEKQVPRYLMMNNHLLSESCSTENYREYDAMRGRAQSDYFKRSHTGPEQRMPAEQIGGDPRNDGRINKPLFEELKMDKEDR